MTTRYNYSMVVAVPVTADDFLPKVAQTQQDVLRDMLTHFGSNEEYIRKYNDGYIKMYLWVEQIDDDAERIIIIMHSRVIVYATPQSELVKLREEQSRVYASMVDAPQPA